MLLWNNIVLLEQSGTTLELDAIGRPTLIPQIAFYYKND